MEARWEFFPLTASWAQKQETNSYVEIQADKHAVHRRTLSYRLVQTCCSYFCLSESSCWENSLTWFSLSVLDRIRSSSTFSIWRHEKNKIKKVYNYFNWRKIINIQIHKFWNVYVKHFRLCSQSGIHICCRKYFKRSFLFIFFYSLFFDPSILPLIIFSLSLSADGVISKWIICISLFRCLSFSHFKISIPFQDCS